ncbi:threonine synthase [Schaalia sp. ZJ405]|uniref:threonine synthase n=1 Tax=Schaalia sp. ZJ405 TaxID=2709403 RepID=UPI0013EE38AC|nr:threonine synthase [Schaalia sp. ZJ405]QPK81515.1 threonine synthase [Schaalia sp. ZJ405]
MRYISTRQGPDVRPRQFCDILLGGLAPDGGLYLPESYPQLTAEDLAGMRTTLNDEGYAALAARILELYIDDIPVEDLREITARAYRTPAFSNPQIVPVTRLENTDDLWIAHLSNGPTAAFKDMAMQLLGELFDYELTRRGDWLTIVGATSGDTGSSAEYALRGRAGLSVVMLTPAGRMTPFQRAQMFSLMDDNIINVAVDGVFDDCQDLVKAVNMDADFKKRWHVGAVNSINWARLLAQVIYYIATWLRVTQTSVEGVTGAAATSGDEDERGPFSRDAHAASVGLPEVSVVVPSGNFGNVCAAHIARQMGVPLKALVVATNENDVLDEFFRTGVYRVRTSDQTLATSSPSMDISKASNFERFVFDLLGRDGERVRELFGECLGTDGFFDLSGTPEYASLRATYGFVSGSSTHADRLVEIARTHDESGYLLDPHTADGVHVARQWREEIDGPVVVMETALPVKFAQTVVEATGHLPDVPERFAGIEGSDQRVVDLPNDVAALKSLIEDEVRQGR